jgi:hypothetical protein
MGPSSRSSHSDRKEQVNYRKAAARGTRLLNKIRAAARAGDGKRAQHLQRLYLSSFDAKLTATREANRRLKPHRRVPKERVPEIAASLNPWRGTNEEVTVRAKPKKWNPDYCRLVMDFGVHNRALQILVGEALRLRAILHPDQFLMQDGRDAACRAVIEHLEAGYTWVIEADINDCYASFDGEKLPGVLPVDHRVVRNVLTARHLNLVPGGLLEDDDDDPIYDEDYVDPCEAGTSDAFSWEALAESFAHDPRQGIPQGSTASPLVAEMMLAQVACALPKCGRRCIYGDNVQLMAKSEGEVAMMLKALRRALKCHPAGVLRSKATGPRHAAGSFDFLGYEFTISDVAARVAPSRENLIKFEMELERRTSWIRRASDPNIKKQRSKKLREYVRSWCAAFSLWPGIADHRDKALKYVLSSASS